ncbi:MAG: flagellar FliJ family protein [Leptospirillia bacterium]
MADGRFRLSSVLSLRESDLEKVENELARIAGEIAREMSESESLERLRQEAISSFSEQTGEESGLRTPFYEWLAHMGVLIAEQERRVRLLGESQDQCRKEWQKARMEKEKILILKERFDGETRRREGRRERQAIEGWIVSKRMLDQNKGEEGQ